jgi:hypothetical protein
MTTSRSERKYRDVNTAWQVLVRLAEALSIRCVLTDKEQGRLRRYRVDGEQGHQDRRRDKRRIVKYRRFVANVDASCRELCVIAFPIDGIYYTSNSVLDALAKKTQEGGLIVPNSVQLLFQTSEVTRGPIRDSSDTSKLSVKLAHAALEGVREVFPDGMVQKIEESQEGYEMKAVTMSFPNFPPELESGSPFSCSLTLELHEEAMRELVMALFNVEANWTSNTVQALQVVHESGLRQTMPYLKQMGARCDRIADVFGEKIYLAITNCATYQKEQAEGKDRTTCVSVFWAKGERKVTLEMDVKDSIGISQKLYTKDIQ